MRSALVITALWASACGMPPPSISPNVIIPQAMAADTVAVEVWVLAERRTDGVILTCSNLVLFNENNVDPDSDLVEVLGSDRISFDNSEREFVLPEITSGQNHVVYVEAYGAGDVVIGNGCTDGVNVDPDTTADVTVRIFPLI